MTETIEQAPHHHHNIQKHKGFKDRIIISSDNKLKSFFDVWVLFLVGYSCITSMYYVAFTKPDDVILMYWDNFVEINFWVDILLSFFCEFKDPETN